MAYPYLIYSSSKRRLLCGRLFPFKKEKALYRVSNRDFLVSIKS